MRLLITGAAGMLGQDVVRAAHAEGHAALTRSRAQLDITDASAVRAAVADARPDAVVNCAAWTDVDGAETAEPDATAVNAHGAGVLAAAAAAHGAWTVYLSSDYVFDGRAGTPYVESSPTGPLSAYGRSKLAGEQAVAAAAPAAHTIVRTSWLFGAGGNCFPATIRRLAAQREEITVVDDQVGCPTFTGHLASALVALAHHRPAGILHVAGSGRCSWYDFAREIVARCGLSCAVVPGSTAELARPARRPAFSVLDTERSDVAPRLPAWQAGLADYLSDGVAA